MRWIFNVKLNTTTSEILKIISAPRPKIEVFIYNPLGEIMSAHHVESLMYKIIRRENNNE